MICGRIILRPSDLRATSTPVICGSTRRTLRIGPRRLANSRTTPYLGNTGFGDLDERPRRSATEGRAVHQGRLSTPGVARTGGAAHRTWRRHRDQRRPRQCFDGATRSATQPRCPGRVADVQPEPHPAFRCRRAEHGGTLGVRTDCAADRADGTHRRFAGGVQTRRRTATGGGTAGDYRFATDRQKTVGDCIELQATDIRAQDGRDADDALAHHAGRHCGVGGRYHRGVRQPGESRPAHR